MGNQDDQTEQIPSDNLSCNIRNDQQIENRGPDQQNEQWYDNQDRFYQVHFRIEAGPRECRCRCIDCCCAPFWKQYIICDLRIQQSELERLKSIEDLSRTYRRLGLRLSSRFPQLFGNGSALSNHSEINVVNATESADRVTCIYCITMLELLDQYNN